MRAVDTDFQAVQLTALLHDVGKLYQRSGLRPSTGYDAFTAQDHGAHGAHAKWSADFAERHVADRWPVRPHDLLSHHLPIPPSRTARLVALADRIASGERESEEGPQPAPWESQLLSILPRLSLDGRSTDQEGYHALAPLELRREVLFPKTERLSGQDARDAYLRLWQGFEAEFAALRQDDFDTFLEGLYHLMQRFCWCVPSAAYRQPPDVSLFDHSRLTCAVAACLHLQGLSDADLEELLAWPPREEARRRPILVLVGGDLSGLQRFLYTLAAGRAARTLRGRSFYLQLLAESAARFLLDRLGLSTPNLLYAGGGRFYLLAPATAASTLEEAAGELEARMLDLHGGELGLAVGHAALAAEDFEGERFAGKWAEVGASIGSAKNRRFGRVLRRAYDALFAPTGIGGEGARCEACHAEIAETDAVRADEPRCPTCRGMEELGEQVARASRAPGVTLSLSYKRPDRPGSGWQEGLWRLGTWWEFGALDGSLRYALNDADFTRAGADGFRWMPAVIPWTRRDGHGGVKEFGEIARDAIGVERLGILRMDVDNLGRLFAHGLGNAATASRVAALSSALRLFFEGWVNRVCSEVENDPRMVPDGMRPRSDLFYGVYSGGDDLFIVGAWDRMPLLARRIRSDLAEFAVGNPAVGISAGIALVDAHAPLYQSADDAHWALEDGAKEHRRKDGRAKDAISFMGETLGWEEMDALLPRVESLAQLVGSGPGGSRVPKSLLSMLSALSEMYRREARRLETAGAARSGKPRYGRWTWLAVYGLARAVERARGGDAKTGLLGVQRWLAEPGAIERVGMVARWAEYLTRARGVDRR